MGANRIFSLRRRPSRPDFRSAGVPPRRLGQSAAGLMAALALVLGFALSDAREESAPGAVGLMDMEEQLRSVVLTRLDGGREAFSRYAGKTVILNVWATWCPPCRREMPSLQALGERLDPRRFAVVGLSVDEDGDFVREYLRDTGVTFTNYIDSERAVAEGILGVTSYPQTVVIGPDGKFRKSYVGARDWNDPSMIMTLKTAHGPDGGSGEDRPSWWGAAGHMSMER